MAGKASTHSVISLSMSLIAGRPSVLLLFFLNISEAMYPVITFTARSQNTFPFVANLWP